MAFEIVRNVPASRFETMVEGVLCVLEYRLRDGRFAIDHVQVPDAVGGRGIAAALTKAALDTARREHWIVVPNCAYAAAYMERNPGYRDLLGH